MLVDKTHASDGPTGAGTAERVLVQPADGSAPRPSEGPAPRMKITAKQLRDLEKKTKWQTLLRGQLLAHRIVSPFLVEEHKFLPDRNYRFDFAIPTLLIGIEIEGGVWARQGDVVDVVGGRLVTKPGTKSRHTTGAGYAEDTRKYNLAGIAGWLVLRFTSTELVTGEAVNMIRAAMKSRGAV